MTLDDMPDISPDNSTSSGFDDMPDVKPDISESLEPYKPSFLEKVKNDAENIVSNYFDGARKAWNEMGRAQTQQIDLFDPIKNPNSITHQQAADSQNYISDAGNLGLNPLMVIPQVGMAKYAADSIKHGIDEGNPLVTARDLTYGPLVDSLSQDNLGQKFSDHPLETGGEIALSALPLVGAGFMAKRGIKAGMNYFDTSRKSYKAGLDDMPDIQRDVGTANFDDMPDIEPDISTSSGLDDMPDINSNSQNVPSNNGGGFDSFMNGVSAQESGGNYSARNSDTGAYGKFQIMPGNWESWKNEAASAGVDVGSGRMNDPAAQEAVAHYKMHQYYNEYGPDGALVAWYAGPGNAERWAAGKDTDVWGKPWDRAQSNGPSIAEYVRSAMNHAAESGYKDDGVRNAGFDSTAFKDEPLEDIANNDKAIEDFNNQDNVVGNDNNSADNLSNDGTIKTDANDIMPKQPDTADVNWGDNDLISQAHKAADNGDYQTAMQLAYKAGDDNWGQAYRNMIDRQRNEDIQAYVNNAMDNLTKNNLDEPASKNTDNIRIVNSEVKNMLNPDKIGEKTNGINVNLMRTPAGQDAIRIINDSFKEMSKSNEDTYFDVAQNGDYAKAAELARQAGDNDFADAFQRLADTDGGTIPPTPRLNNVKTGNYAGNTITMQHILKRAQQLFVPIRTGRIGMKDVQGMAKHNVGTVRIRNHGDIDVLSHELGHITDAALGLRSDAGAFDGEFSRVVHERFGNAYDSSQVRSEGIAEFMHDYLTDDAKAKQEFPRYYDAFKGELAKSPDMQGRISELKSMVDTWQKQSPEARARSSVSYSKDLKPSKMERLKNAYHNFVESVVDDKDPIQRATESYEKLTGQKLETQDNPYKMARLAQNSATARAQMLIESDNPTLVKNALNKSYGNIIDDGVTVKSILKNLDQAVKGKYDSYLKQGGFDNWHEALDSLLLARRQAEIQSIYTDYKGPLSRADALKIINNAPAELTRAAKQVYIYNGNILKIMRHTGMIKPEVYDALTEKYQNYVPMARDFSDEAGIIKGFGIGGKGYANIRNIMKSLSEEGSTRSVISPLESITKNTYTLLNLAERNKVGQIFAKMADGDRTGSFVERVAGSAAQKDSTFSVWVGGEKQVYQTTPEIYKAIMSMNQESADIVAKLLSPPAQLLRAGATLMPDFAIKNIMRDSFGAAVFSRYGFRPVVDHIAGIMHMVKQDQLFHDYKSSGALMSTMVGMDRDFVQASLKGLYKKDASYYWKHYNPVQILRGFSEMLETATRLGEYDRAIKKGASMEDAALSARDISLDFSKAGSKGRVWNKWTAFFNASIQEPARIFQAFKEDPVKTSVKTMAYITLPSIVLWSMNHDQDWYKELPSYQKNLFWCFKAGDTVYRIPKPFGLGVLFGSLPERTLDWAYNKDPDAMEKWATAAKDAFLPNILPTAIGPIIEWMTNYSFFTGRNIVPQREQKLPNAQQYGQNTSELAKEVGKMFDLSPRQIDNLIRGYGAGMATQTLNAVDAATGHREMSNPFSKAFTIDPMRSPQSIQDFYDKLDNSEKIYNGSKTAKTSIDGNDLYNYRLMNFANKKMQFLNKQERFATQKNDKDAVNNINKEQLKVAQDALKMYKNK